MIIGLSGKIGSGKDLTARLIQKHFIDKRIESGELQDYLSITLEECLGSTSVDLDRHSQWQIKKFADKLKSFASEVTGIAKSNFESQEFKRSNLPEDWNIDGLPMTVRDLLIRIGNGSRDVIHPSIWVLATFSDYQPIVVEPTLPENPIQYPQWLLTDVRYPNELQKIKQEGGITIRLEREGTQKINHISETALDEANFDFTIYNNGSVEELSNRVKDVLIAANLL